MAELQVQERREKTADCLVLFAVVLVSALPYLFRLGFYADDWDYYGVVARYSGDGLFALVRWMIGADNHLLLRPVQLTFLVLGLKAFGLNAIPYILIISSLLGIATFLLYLTLREIQIERFVALAIAVTYGMLPHYSTDRFWVTANYAAFCMVFALLGIYALLISIRPGVKHPLRWVLLAAAAIVLSVLSYEVALGFVVASLAVIGWYVFTHGNRSSQRTSWLRLGYVAAPAAILMLVVIVKGRLETLLVYHHHLFKHFGALVWHALAQAVLFNFWTYGIHMPFLLVSLHRDSALSAPAFCTAAGIVSIVTAYLWRHMESAAIPDWRLCLWLILASFVLFGLGFVFYFPDLNSDFSGMGLESRSVIASALGAACALIAAVGLGCGLLKNTTIRIRAFSVTIGMVCGANILATYGIIHTWEDAAREQSLILNSVSAHVHSLPHGSVLLLDGFCPNLRYALVFYINSDTTGALYSVLKDRSLQGDVISRDAHFQADGVDMTLDGEPEGHYPYGDHLFVYNVRYEYLSTLPSLEAANRYLQAMNPSGDSGCPVPAD